MSKETVKILIAVLRVFVTSIGKGNLVTLHANEVTNQVCRNLHRRKEKEKKNTHGFVVTALRALKGHKVLFEVVDNWDDDKLKRFKPVDGRKVFGLTDPAVDFATKHKNAGETITTDQFMLTMLQYFDVLPAEPKPAETVPAVLVEAITEIKESEKEMTLTTVNHNAARIASEIANLESHTDFTPRRLLGTLRELEAFSADTAALAPTIGWEPHQIQKCRHELMRRDLIAWRKIVPVNFESRDKATRYEGLYLTPLGRAVAEAGDFVNDLPPEKRWTRKTKQKEGSMLKDSKKPETTPPVSVEGKIVLKLRDGTTLYCSSPKEAAEAYAALGSAAGAVESVADAPAAVQTQTTVGTYKTIAEMLRAVTNAMCSAINGLSTMDGANAVNVDAVSCSLTEIGHLITGFKHYINNCLKTDTDVDVKMLQDYAAQMELDLERFEKRHEFPVLGDVDADTGCGRVLRGSKSIRKTVWTA